MNYLISNMRESTFGELISQYAPDELNMFSNLRVFIDDTNNFWFIGSEVASIMGYSDTDQALRKHVPDDYKYMLTKANHDFIIPSNQRDDHTWRLLLISELGLYSLAMRSNLPQAKEFQDWVYRVISRIRQYGGYISPNSNIKQVVDIIPEQYRQSITNMIDIKNKIIDEQQRVINRQKSSLELGNAFNALNNSIIRDQQDKLNILAHMIYDIVAR